MAFQKSEIDYLRSGSLSRLVSDYLNGKKELSPFYHVMPDEADFVKAIDARKSHPVDRITLVQVLANQHEASAEAAKKNTQLLSIDNTFTITTGHQLNLFTGPLYFIYKILTVIGLSQKMKAKFPDLNFVPVYWMATEDHDIAEINHTYMYGKKLQWNTTQTGPAGRLDCAGIEALVEDLKAMAGENSHSEELISVLRHAYQPGRTLAQATRILVDQFFGNYGLVIIDADDPNLKKLFADVMRDDLLHQSAFTKINETIASLEQFNYEIQVRPREINLFYLASNSRERIVVENGRYRVLNSIVSWTQEEVLKELDEHPERFSPNVVLRPLYQELLLPDIAYVGGPAEIAYWLELKSTADHYHLNFPLLILRNSGMIIEDMVAHKMSKLGISNEALFKSYDELAKEFVKRNPGSLSIGEEASRIASAFDDLIKKTGPFDATLAKGIEGEKQKQMNMLKTLEEKITRAQKKKHETSLQQIQKLKDKLFPEGTLQERHDNFIPYYLKYGNSFFDFVLESFQPPSKKFVILTEKIPVPAG